MGSLLAVNYIAVLAAAVAAFLFGGAYYGLLANPWMRALGKTREELQRTGMVFPMLVGFLALVIMAIVLAGIIHHVAPLGGRSQIRGGLISGALCWLGFVVTTLATNHGYQGQNRSLTLIDGGHWFGVLLIQGAVLGAIGV